MQKRRKSYEVEYDTPQRAEVAELGQRRQIQGLVPQGFAGSNPALRTEYQTSEKFTPLLSVSFYYFFWFIGLYFFYIKKVFIVSACLINVSV